MNIFNKIKNIIDRQKVIDEFYDDVENLDEVLLNKRLEIFQKVVSPRLAKIGLKNWNGKYIWFSDFNDDGIKHVVEYNVFKGFGGSFSFGNCFDCVPTISGKKLVNHRTDKSTKIIYFKRLEGWQESYEKNKPINPDRISTINEQKFRDSLERVLFNNVPKIKNWFEGKSTLEENIDGLLYDVKNPAFEIGQRIISSEYILSFLYKRNDDIESAEFWLNEHFKKGINSELEIELLTKRIKN
ncbi:hypothetical protein Q4603_22160 [Zobellia galactanivorans]|uniref:hypothetical protein n=1 Tax=Zobellia galactanivorans (strain DSM 12802 / CCUG 47099 / CIP 106680 / NCIMB 13871 / Dsij) TaxID=63186 RepID=UPI0026E3F6A1|nr:hypothetical protein [Zobellia galactanivorans]MDO6811334.1 hypothetical protein [Zobellia galactanivorans]